jgi:hypothetical protein
VSLSVLNPEIEMIHTSMYIFYLRADYKKKKKKRTRTNLFYFSAVTVK